MVVVVMVVMMMMMAEGWINGCSRCCGLIIVFKKAIASQLIYIFECVLDFWIFDVGFFGKPIVFPNHVDIESSAVW